MKNNNYCIEKLIGEFTVANHVVTLKKANSKAKQISILKVLEFIRDAELVHFASKFGKVVNERGMICEKPKEARFAGMEIYTGTRWLDVELDEGVSMPGFIWIKSVNEDQHISRITVKHSSQAQCCYNCLEASPICKAAGNGRLCKRDGYAKVDYNNTC